MAVVIMMIVMMMISDDDDDSNDDVPVVRQTRSTAARIGTCYMNDGTMMTISM